VARVSDAFNQTASDVGFSTYQSPATRFDQLLVTPQPPCTDVSVAIAAPVMIRSGDTGNWSITVQNRSTGSIAGAEVLVTPPPQLESISVGGPSCSLQGSQYRCVTGSLAPGETATISLTGIAPPVQGVLTLSAFTAAQPGETQTSNNTASRTTPVRRAIPSNALVVDLFDRADSTTFGVADTGQTWTTHTGIVGISGHDATLVAGLATLNSGVTDGDVSVRVAAVSSEFWLVLRLSDSQNYWRFGRWHDGPYQLQQIRTDQLAAPALQQLNTVQPSPGDQITCRVNALGIDCAVNDAAVVRTTDTFNRAATRIGVSGYGAGPARFDDFVFVQVPAGPDLGVSVQASAVALAGQNQTVRIDVKNNGCRSLVDRLASIVERGGGDFTRLHADIARSVHAGITDRARWASTGRAHVFNNDEWYIFR
jgi:hypothetical protein